MSSPSWQRSASPLVPRGLGVPEGGSAGAGSRIVITGLGPVGPLGVGREALAASLAKGLDPVELGPLRVEDYATSAKTYLDPNSLLTLAATSLALRDAGIRDGDRDGPDSGTVPISVPNSADSRRGEKEVGTVPFDAIGMSYGTRFGNVATVEAYLKMFREQGAKLASPLLFIHAYPNTSLSLAAIEFKLMGTSFNFDSGRACGVQALVQAFDELRAGKMSVMLAGAGDTYTETTRRCAVGKARNAAAALVLEREGDALARGAHALAEVAGCGLSRSADQALSRALAQASLGRPQIDWLLVDAPDDNIGASTGIHATDLLRAVGDSGAATALTGVALAALAIREMGTVPFLGLVEPPLAAAVVSADEIGAAAVVLRRISN